MTDNVVKLPPREERERAIWICNCGCRSMNLLADGTAECAACDALVDDTRGGWFSRLEKAKSYESPTTPFESISFGHIPDEDLARRRVANRVHEKDTVAAVVVKSDGVISTWTRVSDPKQHKWLKGRLSAAWLLMNPRRS